MSARCTPVLCAALAAWAALNAAETHVAAPGAAASEVSLTLDVNFGIRYVPPARVTVPAGSLVRVSAPDLGALQWTRNGRALPGATSATLILTAVQLADAGSYVANYVDPVMAGRGSQTLILGVGPVDRLVNVSVRETLPPGGAFVAGFVVTGSAQPKKLIVRAVGPSLAGFGIADPLRRPALQLHDSEGRVYENSYAYPAVVGGPTYETDLADSLARCGAFPLASGTADVVVMRPFVPGSYTAHVSSADGSGGTVLLEVYEVP